MINKIDREACPPAVGRPRRRGLRRATAALLVSMVAGTGVAVAASPAWADQPPTKLPQNASKAQLKFQPAMDYDTDGCYPSVAVGAYGDLNEGLKTSGALNGSCRDESDLENSNMYARSHCNANGWCAHMYTLYFQKDQTLPGGCLDEDGCGHRHDWEQIVVWTKDDRAEYVSTSAHGKFSTKPASQVVFQDTHPKIVYHKDGASTHAFRFARASEAPENHWGKWHFPDLVSWNGYPSIRVRDIMAGHNWGHATFPFNDYVENPKNTFVGHLERAYQKLTFGFDINEHSLPAGMPDPNTPTVEALRPMALGSSTTYGEGSSDGNGYRGTADRGFRDLIRQSSGSSSPSVDWVGSVRVGQMADRDVEGWRGFTIDGIAGKAKCAVKTYQPNLITLIAGGNDVIQDYQMDGAIGRLEALIEQVNADAPGVAVLVSGVQPFHDPARNARGQVFTVQIPPLVKRLVKKGLHVVYVDTTGLRQSDIGSDGIHPTDRGYEKIGEAFVKAAGEARDNGWIRKPGPQAPNAGSHPCGLKDDGAGIPVPSQKNLGPNWEDRGVIQAKEFPSSSRFWMVDVNKDRKAEFVVVDKNQNFRFWWNGGPSGKTWTPFVEGQNSYTPAAGAVGNMLRFGDVDGDGFPDCMVVWLNGRVDVSTWKADNPSGSRMCMDNEKFMGAGVYSEGSEGDRLTIDPDTKIRFADVTGGGRDDYLLIEPDGTTTAWYNQGLQVRRTFPYLKWDLPKKISGALAKPREIRYADINGDKRADRILITANGGARAWINEGATGSGGTYRDIGRIAGDSGLPPKDIQFADIDGDGKADLLRIGWTGVTHAWLNKLPANYFDTFHP
ncbi:NPP1 family protein [Sphaerimonospora cavernae]|uniref:NPP1 family protein n=1 Tax=Sphaerimonospora cavernae TaxID=1740611 RepID=A0ABV6UBR8_9ACTN